MWHIGSPNAARHSSFFGSLLDRSGQRGPVAAEAGFQDLALRLRSRRHPDDFGCRQGGRREGRGFPGPPSQNP
jgi:hypothetical protein